MFMSFKDSKTALKQKLMAIHSENAMFFYYAARLTRAAFPALLIYALGAVNAYSQNPFGGGMQEAGTTLNGFVKFALWVLPFAGFFCALLTLWKYRKKDETWTREGIVTLVCFGLWAPLMGWAWDTSNNKGNYDMEDFRVDR